MIEWVQYGGRQAGRHPGLALAVIALTIGILTGYCTPEDYPIECEERNRHELTAEERERLCP